jgi:methionine synthase II (cobalamin-independent)
MLDQERAGVDVISDGEMRRLGSFYRTYLRRIEGIRMEPAERTWPVPVIIPAKTIKSQVRSALPAA